MDLKIYEGLDVEAEFLVIYDSVKAGYVLCVDEPLYARLLCGGVMTDLTGYLL